MEPVDGPVATPAGPAGDEVESARAGHDGWGEVRLWSAVAALGLVVLVVAGRFFLAGDGSEASTAAVPGQQLRFSGDGCEGGETVTLTLGASPLATATADGAGVWRTEITFTEATPAGRHQVLAACGSLERTIDVLVLDAPGEDDSSSAAGSGGGLRTVVGGIVLVVLVGAAIVVRGRRLPK